jgi:L-iditol 2-dehydrogenase
MTLNNEQIRRIVSEVIRKANAQPSTPVETAAVQIPAGAPSGRAAVLTAPRQLELREFPLRAIGPDEILVKVEACGVCGTDIHCYKSDPFGLAPVILGHEGTGEVIEVGRNIKMDSVGKRVRVGDKIVTSILDTTDSCMYAKYNPVKSNLCDDLRVYGLLPDEPENHFNEYPNAYHFLRRAEGIGLPVTSLITHKFSLDQIQEAFDVNLRQESVKVLVEAK